MFVYFRRYGPPGRHLLVELQIFSSTGDHALDCWSWQKSADQCLKNMLNHRISSGNRSPRMRSMTFRAPNIQRFYTKQHTAKVRSPGPGHKGTSPRPDLTLLIQKQSSLIPSTTHCTRHITRCRSTGV
jgi:hypothetical protein